jgi:UDP-2,3-diacylglucosamine pyrophosphatase LpxH
VLVFISDLHFLDGSAGEHNLPARAFEYFFDDLVTIARKNNVKEIRLVLLGDTFDLLHTENWFGYPVEETPWGTNEHVLEIHALTLFDAIVEANQQTFKIIRQSVADLGARCQLIHEARLFYLPGNRDRLANRYSSLRKKVCDCLGIPMAWHNPTDPFPHTFDDASYGVFARHGHEFDKFNYEGGTAYAWQDYQEVPIGDLITTELVARLPYTLAQRLEGVKRLTREEKGNIKRNFQEIANVRPFFAIMEWLLYKIQQDRSLKELIEDTLLEIVEYFTGLKFLQNWYERHDKWTDPFDEADQLQALIFLLGKIKVFSAEKLWDLATKMKDSFNFVKEATRENERLESQFRYVVSGHNHAHLVLPLQQMVGGFPTIQNYYINTGTWCSRHKFSAHYGSFVSWRNMVYVIFFREGERRSGYGGFEFRIL